MDIRHPDTFNHMTPPDEFYRNVVSAMDYLDTVLPAGSHVFLTGLANGIRIDINPPPLECKIIK